MDLGVCQFCGKPLPLEISFVESGPTNCVVSSKPRHEKWVPVEEAIHGWEPFVVSHPVCYAKAHGVAALVALVDEHDRTTRQRG